MNITSINKSYGHYFYDRSKSTIPDEIYHLGAYKPAFNYDNLKNKMFKYLYC